MRVTPAVLLVLCLALAGCSGPSTPAASGSTAPAPVTTDPAPTTEPTADPPALPTPTGPPPSTSALSPTPVRTTAAPPQDPLSPSPALESAAPLGQPTCRPAALTLVDADQLSSSTSVQEVFSLRTRGAPCQLEGYPTVRLLDAAGATLPLTYRHGGFGLSPAGPRPVTISPDTTASLELGTARTGTCRAAATVVVTLAGDTTSLRAATTLRVCGGSVGVSPILRRADAEAG